MDGLSPCQANPDTGADIVIWDTQEQRLNTFLNSRASECAPEFSPTAAGWSTVQRDRPP